MQSRRAPWRWQPPPSCKGQMLLAEPHSVVLMSPDNTANITVKYGQFDRERAKFHYLPVLISDNGIPSLTGTSTLAVAVCKCNEQGEFTFCEEAAAQVGVSIQALVAIFLCILTITGRYLQGWGGSTKGVSWEKRPGIQAHPCLHPRRSFWTMYHPGLHGSMYRLQGCRVPPTWVGKNRGKGTQGEEKAECKSPAPLFKPTPLQDNPGRGCSSAEHRSPSTHEASDSTPSTEKEDKTKTLFDIHSF